jgi:hypothetical protein
MYENVAVYIKKRIVKNLHNDFMEDIDEGNYRDKS